MGALTHNGEVLQNLPADASQINFDKTGTDLNSTQTEAAIKEVNTKVNTNTEDITQLKSGLTVNTAIIDTLRAVGHARKVGHIISINIYNGGFFNADPEDVLFTLPEGYRPSNEVSVLNAIGDKQRIAIYPDGNVVTKESFTTGYIRFNVTFIN